MRKRLLSAFISLLPICAVWAQETTTVDGVVYELDVEGQTARAKGLAESGVTQVVIPQTVTSDDKTYAVTSIGANAFRDTNIESISLPEGLKVIEALAFSGCTYLRQMRGLFLPASLDSIGESAFSNMNGEIRFYFRSETPPACQGDPFIISQDDRNRTMGYIYFPTRAADPFQTDFRGFDQLIPGNYYMSLLPWSGIDEEHHFVFAVNEAEQTACVVKSYLWSDVVDIPASVEFEGRQYTVTSIRHSAFSPSGIYFIDNVTVRTLSLPSTLEVIGDYAFAMSYGLMSVELPSSLRYVGDYAFDGCFIGEDYKTSLEPQGSVHIPASVDSIGANSFYVKHITVDPANKHYDSRDNCDGVVRTADNTLVLMAAAFDEIPASVEGIGRNLFRGSKMRQISLPAGLKRIEDDAFIECKNLQSIELPEGLQSVGRSAFAACDSIQSLRIPASLREIGDGAFCGCLWMSHIEVDPANPVFDSRDNCNAIVRTADNTLIRGCLTPRELREGEIPLDGDTLVIPVSVERVESFAYGFCNYPRTHLNIRYSSFPRSYSKPWVDVIVLPPSVKSVGSGAFDAMKYSSKAVVLNDNMEAYDIFTFKGENGVERIERFPVDRPTFLSVNSVYVGAAVLARIEAGETKALELKSALNSNYSVTFRPISTLVIDGRYSIDTDAMTADVVKGWVDTDGECHVPADFDKWGMHFAVSGIAANAFQRNADLKAIFLPASMTTIGDMAFSSSGLERIEGTDQVTWVGRRAFDSTPWVQDAPSVGGVVYVGHCAYTYGSDANNMSSITLREGTTQVAEEAFRDLYFTELTLPASVKSIGMSAISGDVTTIRSYIREPFELPRQRWRSSQLRNKEITCYVPHGTLEAYQALSIWNQLVLVEMEPDGVPAVKGGTAKSDAIYSIDGVRRSTVVKGINFLRTADGSVRKLLVK